MIESIRPKVLFRSIEEKFPNQNVGFKVNIPSPDIGGLTLLESSILASLCKLFDCTSIFEFGTFMGATTLLLAENTSPHAQVFTLDIVESDADRRSKTSSMTQEARAKTVLTDGIANDDFLRDQFNRIGARCIRHADDTIKSKITQIYKDSLLMDVVHDELKERFDFVFIDGGHDYETVKKDTESAYLMARSNAVIAWHDFESKIHGDVTTFLNEHSPRRRIFHVENTMIAFELLGEFGNEFD